MKGESVYCVVCVFSSNYKHRENSTKREVQLMSNLFGSVHNIALCNFSKDRYMMYNFQNTRLECLISNTNKFR